MSRSILPWYEDASTDQWWASVPAHIRRRVEDTARTARSRSAHDDDDRWWLPIVEHLLETHTLALPLDVDRERRAARDHAEVRVDAMRAELARVRAAASESAAAHWERRAHRAARLVAGTGRKTVPREALWDALELTGGFGGPQFKEIESLAGDQAEHMTAADVQRREGFTSTLTRRRGEDDTPGERPRQAVDTL